jgi:hypothetical protein
MKDTEIKGMSLRELKEQIECTGDSYHDAVVLPMFNDSTPKQVAQANLSAARLKPLHQRLLDELGRRTAKS